MRVFYLEMFYDVYGKPWYRAVHLATGLQAVAATADQAVDAVLRQLNHLRV